MSVSWIFCIVLGALCLFFLVKYLCLKKEVSSIIRDFSEKISQDTNTLIDISTGDREIRRLAVQLNHELKDLREARQRYERGDGELKDAIVNISHDLRTPLTALFGYIELLEQKNGSEEVQQYLGLMKNRCEALKGLTEELFRYSILVSVPEDKPQKTDVSRVLQQSLLDYYGALKQRGIEPEVNLPGEKVERFMDPVLLARIFSNLIGNAIKYSDHDLSVTMDGNGTIVFRNSARTLDTISVGRLFDRFYTVENGRSSTGLGLSIAKLLTERLGGTIRADFENSNLSIILSFPET